MKIPNSEHAAIFKENEELLKRMNKGLERKIANKEQEIKDIDALYDKKIEQAKTTGEEDFIQNLERNQQKNIAESKVFEEKIQGYKDQLKKAQDAVTKEETILKDAHQAKLGELKKQTEENFQDQFISTQENQREIQSAIQNSVKEIATNSKADKLTMENNAQFEINALSSEFNQKSANSEKDFRDKLQNDVRIHNAEVSRQRDELKKVMLVDTEKNKRMSDEKNRVHKEQMNFQDQFQKGLMQQRDQDFKVRYEKMVNEHNSILKELSSRFESDVKKMVDKTSTERKKIEDKNQDPFYRVDKMNPKLVEDPKFVTISMPVAEYEKENVHLSTQGREIKITLSRRYSDSMASEDGSVNRSTRSELFSKELNARDILDPRGIVQNYADGILTFKIKKA